MYQTTGKKGLPDLMRKRVSANLWAHRRYVAWLRPKDPELLSRVVPSSFPSISETMVHIWNAERIWLSVLQRKARPPSLAGYSFGGSLEDVFSGLVEQSALFESYVHTLGEEALLEECVYQSRWGAGAQPLYDFITQAMEHSGYHRGQIVTIGRQIGIEDAPLNEYIAFLMMPEG